MHSMSVTISTAAQPFTHLVYNDSQFTHNKNHAIQPNSVSRLRTLHVRNVTNFQPPTDTKEEATTNHAVTDFAGKYTSHKVLPSEGVAEMKLELPCSVGFYKEFRPTQNTWVSVLTQKM
jgi:hypothetical protein